MIECFLRDGEMKKYPVSLLQIKNGKDLSKAVYTNAKEKEIDLGKEIKVCVLDEDLFNDIKESLENNSVSTFNRKEFFISMDFDFHGQPYSIEAYDYLNTFEHCNVNYKGTLKDVFYKNIIEVI